MRRHMGTAVSTVGSSFRSDLVVRIHKRNMEDVVQAIGSLVLACAHLEHRVEDMVDTLMRHGSARKLAGGLPPANFKGKVDFLSRALAELPVLRGLREEGLRIVSVVSKLAETRHHLVHGRLEKYDSKWPLLTFVCAVEGGTDVTTLTLRGSDLGEWAEMALAAMPRSDHFTKRLTGALVKRSKIQKPKSAR